MNHFMLLGRSRRLALLGAVLLGGCASFSGHPKPVFPVKNSIRFDDQNDRWNLLEAYNSKAAQDRRRYRDQVITTYLGAADARYAEFTQALSRESKGLGAGLGGAGLASSSAAAVSGERTANILSAVSAAISGTQALLAKELYFEKTLPALIAGMDAARLRIGTIIRLGMTKSDDEYPLSTALDDLSKYETAAFLDTAIASITAAANAELNKEKERSEVTLVPEFAAAGVQDLRRDIRPTLLALQGNSDTAALNRIAAELNITPGSSNAETAQAIAREFAKVAGDLEKTRALRDRFYSALGQENDDE